MPQVVKESMESTTQTEMRAPLLDTPTPPPPSVSAMSNMCTCPNPIATRKTVYACTSCGHKTPPAPPPPRTLGFQIENFLCAAGVGVFAWDVYAQRRDDPFRNETKVEKIARLNKELIQLQIRSLEERSRPNDETGDFWEFIVFLILVVVFVIFLYYYAKMKESQKKEMPKEKDAGKNPTETHVALELPEVHTLKK